MVMDNRKYHCRDIEKEKTMADNRNALAELVHELNDICCDLTVKQGLLLVIKAKRIVAELAKVRNHECSTEPMFFDCKNAIRRCRAIAEEGAGDGR